MSEILPAAAEPTEAAAAEAHKLEQRIKDRIRLIKSAWVQLAEYLYDFKEGQAYTDLGYGSFEAWLADPEVELERRWAYHLIDTYKVLVLGRGLPRERLEGLHVSKVREVLPALRRGQVDLEVALSDVETLNRSELEIHYRGLASSTPGRPDVSSRMETDREPEFFICDACGSRVRRGQR